jgi:hypothetical protein
MALLGSFIDVRTIAALASNGSVSFAHGLPAAPDFVFVQATETSASGNWAAVADATNVTISARGVACPVGRVMSIVAHSVIR